MKKISFAMIVTSFFTSNVIASTNENTLDNKDKQLEQRLLAAEKRVHDAEVEIQQLKTTSSKTTVPVVPSEQSVSSEADKNAPKLTLSGYGDLKFYGDVEFNMDAASNSHSMTSIRRSPNTYWAEGSNERWGINGRILLGVDGYRLLNNGNFAGFSVQPLADLTGKMGMDDAVFFFGHENDWKIKVGRFEAYDMFPLNQDTFIEYSGNTSNDLYGDGFGYIYMMKEGRGRSDSGGSFLMSKTVDNWYFEVNTLIEKGTSLYQDKSYHGNEMVDEKNVAYLRPVISWSKDNFSIATAMEAQVVNNAYGYHDINGQLVDQSKRIGYGLNM